MATSIWFSYIPTGIVSALVHLSLVPSWSRQKEEVTSGFLTVHLFGLGSICGLGWGWYFSWHHQSYWVRSPVAAVAVRYLWFLSIGIIPLFFSVIRSLAGFAGLDQTVRVPHALLLPSSIVDLTISLISSLGVPGIRGAGSGLGTSWLIGSCWGISVLVLFKQEKLKYMERRIPFNMDKIKEGVRLGLLSELSLRKWLSFPYGWFDCG